MAMGAAVPTVLAANLPYNVAVPVVLNLLAALPSLRHGVVMVQAEVADRMCAGPGSRVYTESRRPSSPGLRSLDPPGTVPRGVFWPVPNVDSKLVAFTLAAGHAAKCGEPRGGVRGGRRRLWPAPQDAARRNASCGWARSAAD